MWAVVTFSSFQYKFKLPLKSLTQRIFHKNSLFDPLNELNRKTLPLSNTFSLLLTDLWYGSSLLRFRLVFCEYHFNEAPNWWPARRLFLRLETLMDLSSCSVVHHRLPLLLLLCVQPVLFFGWSTLKYDISAREDQLYCLLFKWIYWLFLASLPVLDRTAVMMTGKLKKRERREMMLTASTHRHPNYNACLINTMVFTCADMTAQWFPNNTRFLIS